MNGFDSAIRKNEIARPSPSKTKCHQGSNATPLTSSNQTLQRKVRVGSTNDPQEAEADRAADAVLRGDSIFALNAGTGSVQRKCSQCAEEDSKTIQRQPEEEEEEMLQAKPAEGGLIQRQEEEEEEEMLQAKSKSGGACSACSQNAGDSAASAVASGGRPLSESERSYFEPRFGRDFSDVNIHTHSSAEKAAGDINARAFTLGNDIAFSSGQFSPNSSSGRHLLAHELAHVVQQDGGKQNTVRRTVSKFSRCKGGKHSAPAKPLDRLKTIDSKARVFAFGTGLGLSLTAIDPVLFKKDVEAFTKRFGKAPASGKKFKNRFNNKKFDTQQKAITAEMESAAGLYSKVKKRLEKPIVYRCPGGTAKINLENCRDDCKPKKGIIPAAWVCAGSSMREMAICPPFWGFTSDDRLAGLLIHEVVHATLSRPGHPQDVDKRHLNPECFASFAADMQGFTPIDSRCPKIP